MSRIQVTWVVKTKDGRVKGPYSTDAIMRMIKEGVFSGQEMISKIPDGHWTKILREPSFYDALLEALEGVVKVDPEKAKKMEAETVIIQVQPTQKKVEPRTEPQDNPDSTSEPPSFLQPLPSSSPNKIDLYEKAPSVPAKSLPQNKKSDEVIELSNIDQLQGKALKKPLMRLLIGIAVGFVFLLFMLDGGDSSSGKIRLLYPVRSTSNLSEQAVKTKLNEALLNIESDTFEGYRSAQSTLVSIIEGAPMNIEVRALLCVVHKELWPYSFQDAQDIKTITAATQATKALNVVSPFGQVCEVAKLMMAGRYKEAKGVVEATLETTEPFSLLAVMYSYKAELLEGEKDYLNAAPYFDKAFQLWQKWLHPYVSLAKIHYDTQSYSDALQLVQRVLGLNPKHKEAVLLKGLIEYRGFRNQESAFESLSSGTKMSGRVPPLLEADALTSLAEIYIARGEKGPALSAAEKAYTLNPNSNSIKQLVVRLGGNTQKGEASVNTELLYLGDQYVRQGDYLAAQAEFKAAFEADPKSGTAAMKAAKALWQLNQSFEAVEWLKKAIKAEPKLVSAYVLQADYLSQRYDFANATRVLTTAMKIAPNNYEILRGFAQVEFRKNNMPAAINYAMRAIKIYDGDVESYILLSQANGILSRAIVPINKKEIERKENTAKDSIRYATKAVEIDATNPDAQIVYAKMLAAANGVDSGISYIQELIKRYSYTTEYRIALAEIYRIEDRFNQARDIYHRITAVEPRNKKAWLGLGESERALGLNDKALKSFLTAAVLDPSDGEALFQAGKLYLETGRFEEAIQQFQRVQRINPHFPQTHYYIGKSAFSSGDFKTALDSAQAEKKVNPNVADAYILAAEVYMARRQFTECASEYATAMKLRPQGADIYVKTASCYRRAGSFEVAEDMLAMAAERESGYADIYREQGALYELRGDARSAAMAYKKYIGLSPNAMDRAEIEMKIQSLDN